MTGLLLNLFISGALFLLDIDLGIECLSYPLKCKLKLSKFEAINLWAQVCHGEIHYKAE
jgi:hypothetical protein